MLKLTEQNFKEEVLNSKEIVLVDFWATWCGPCQMLGPVIEEISKEYEGRVKVGKVNVDEESNLAIEYDVMSIPALILYKDGKIIDTVIGYHSKNELEEFLNSKI